MPIRKGLAHGEGRRKAHDDWLARFLQPTYVTMVLLVRAINPLLMQDIGHHVPRQLAVALPSSSSHDYALLEGIKIKNCIFTRTLHLTTLKALSLSIYFSPCLSSHLISVSLSI